MNPLNTDDAATIRCSMRSYARMILPLFLFPIVLKFLEYFLQQRDTCPAWGAPEWKVVFDGGVVVGSLLGELPRMGRMVGVEGGHPPARVAWGFAGLLVGWVLLDYFFSYKYLRDMYHLPNVHVLQFTLYEWKNAWVLARETLSWWHLPLVITGVVFCAVWIGKHLRKLGAGLAPLSRSAAVGRKLGARLLSVRADAGRQQNQSSMRAPPNPAFAEAALRSQRVDHPARIAACRRGASAGSPAQQFFGRYFESQNAGAYERQPGVDFSRRVFEFGSDQRFGSESHHRSSSRDGHLWLPPLPDLLEHREKPGVSHLRFFGAGLALGTFRRILP